MVSLLKANIKRLTGDIEVSRRYSYFISPIPHIKLALDRQNGVEAALSIRCGEIELKATGEWSGRT